MNIGSVRALQAAARARRRELGLSQAEVAATARSRGLTVTLLEALPVPLANGLGEAMGSVCGELHRDHGVDLRCDAAVAGFDGDGFEADRAQILDHEPADVGIVLRHEHAQSIGGHEQPPHKVAVTGRAEASREPQSDFLDDHRATQGGPTLDRERASWRQYPDGAHPGFSAQPSQHHHAGY